MDATRTDDAPEKRRSGAMSEDEFRIAVQDEVSKAEDWAQSNIREEQERNLRYYLGMPLGNEVPGRSQILSWDVFEIIESAMPGFIEPFFSGDNIGEFMPRGRGDEAFCEQATDVVNYHVKERNEAFMIFSTWLKDGLMSKIGIVRAEWEQPDPKRMELESLDDQQLQQLMQAEQQGQVQILEKESKPDLPGQAQLQQQMQQAMAQYQQAAQQAQAQGQPPPQMPQMPPPPMLHDVTIHQKQDGRICIENVRPENFITSRAAKSLDKARCVGEFLTLTRSEIRERGHADMAETISDFSASHMTDQMTLIRDDTSRVSTAEDSTDESMQEVLLFRGFIRCDYDGDGIAEYRQVLMGGNFVLENEPADCHDYAVWSPITLPHRVVGMAYADPAAEIQRFKTTLTRQYADSLYAANNPRTYVNNQAIGPTTLDDLISTRIGGVVRGNGPAAMAIQPLVTTLVSKDALQGIEYAETMRESRLGITRYNQGLDSESLNKTASGSRMIKTAGDQRQLMTLRIFAETGVKGLFKLVLRLVTKYQDRPGTIRLRDTFVDYDPRQWNPDMDCRVDVGIGTGDKTETVMLLQQFGQALSGLGQPAGVVSPKNVFEFLKALAKNAKLRDADTKMLSDPGDQQQPPKPDPEQIKAQAAQALKQMELQAHAQEAERQRQHDAQLAQGEAQLQAQVDTHRQQVEAQQKDREQGIQAQLNQQTIASKERIEQARIQFEQWKVQATESTKLHIAQMNAEQARQAAEAAWQKEASNGAK